MTWKVRLAVAYLSLIRRAVKRKVLPPRWALRLGAPIRGAEPEPRKRQS